MILIRVVILILCYTCTCANGEETFSWNSSLFNITQLKKDPNFSWGICGCFKKGVINLKCISQCLDRLGTTCYWYVVLCPQEIALWSQTLTNGAQMIAYHDSEDGAVVNWRLGEGAFRSLGVEMGRTFQYAGCASALTPVKSASNYDLQIACLWNGPRPTAKVDFGDVSQPRRLRAYVTRRDFDSVLSKKRLELVFDNPKTGPKPNIQNAQCQLTKAAGNSSNGTTFFNEIGYWGSVVSFDLDQAVGGEWSCRVRGRLGDESSFGPWSTSVSIVDTVHDYGSKPMVQISQANYWNEDADMSYRFEIDGVRSGRLIDYQQWPKVDNDSSYVSYDAAGRSVLSRYPFAFDYVGQYRYEVRDEGRSIVKVDPYDNIEITIYNNNYPENLFDGNITIAERVGQIVYDSRRNRIYFSSEVVYDGKDDFGGPWSLKVIDLETSAVRNLQSNILSPAVTLFYNSTSDQEIDWQTILFLNGSGVCALNTFENESDFSILIDYRDLNAGDLTKISHFAADHSYIYYVNDTDSGLHVYDPSDRSTFNMTLALAPIDKESNVKSAVGEVSFWPIQKVHSLNAYNVENRPLPPDHSLGCFYPNVTNFLVEMIGEGVAAATIVLEPNVSEECLRMQSRPPYVCQISLRDASTETPSPKFDIDFLFQNHSRLSPPVISRNKTMRIILPNLDPDRRYQAVATIGPYNWTVFGLPPTIATKTFDSEYASSISFPITNWVWILLALLAIALIFIICLLFFLCKNRIGENRRGAATNGENWQTRKRQLTNSGLVPFVRESELIFEGVLGSGRYGDVYKGRRKRSYEEVVMKLLHDQESETKKDAFFREALVWGSLRQRSSANEISRAASDRILDIVGVCFADSNAVGSSPNTIGSVLIIEYMNGGRCDEYLKRHRQNLDRSDALNIAKDIAAACVYLNDRGYVHGDLSVRSVYVRMKLDNSKKPLIAKLANFHSARHSADDDYENDEPPRERYCAPEAFDGFANRKTDVWSYGILVWELFMFFEVPETCAPLPYYPPIGPQAPRGTIRFYVKDERKRIECPDQWPIALIGILKSCWSHEPAGRPAFDDLLRSLEKVRFQNSSNHSISDGSYEAQQLTSGDTESKNKNGNRQQKSKLEEDRVPILRADDEE